jgi:hypothetical protein
MTNTAQAGHNPFGQRTSSQDKRVELLKAYVAGEVSVHDLRRSGFGRNTDILAGLADLGLRPPLAAMDGPNVDTRRAGIARLEKILDRVP